MLGCKELTEACKNASSNAIQKKQINTIQIIFPQQKKLNLTSGLLVEYKKPVGKKAHLHVPSNWGELVFFIFGDLQLVPSPQGAHVVLKKGEIHKKIYNSFWCITNLLPMVVAEWRLLGRGMALLTAGFDHVIVSWRKKNKTKYKIKFNEVGVTKTERSLPAGKDIRIYSLQNLVIFWLRFTTLPRIYMQSISLLS